jgi:hypothetical protein
MKRVFSLDCACGLGNQKGLRETGPPAAGQGY